ncbi:Protein phosphatase 2C family protein [Rhynchospora pubera]|uniref:protein-serine/threonine phosphatase n=1 Tax=Rhynchospora pubera TaxID=906938 RepID=A0AAV8GFG5_9POAL|nr:Protein phosphatase 2C family protein [Rhynchospora pubera]
MGNACGCINRPHDWKEKKGNVVTKRDASDALFPSKRIPREDNLHLFPNRIFSNDGRNRSASIFTQQGRKGINQDAMLLWDEFGGDEEGGVLCGVFDGHGPHGHLVARRVRDVLPLKILESLKGKGNKECKCCDMEVADWRRAFLKAYRGMDKDLRSHPSVDCFCSGSTAVTLLKIGSNLFVGNIGDSRAVLGTKDENNGEVLPVQITVDLKPDLPNEAERIKSCKGRVFALQDEPEVPRVWLPFDDAPGLAMARAFGDFCLKEYGVISVPDFFHWPLSSRDQFVVLASDGVWDVLSNKQVVDIVSSCENRYTAARSLVEAADREWKSKYPTSKMDDCAVVCLFLDGKADTPSDFSETNSSSPADNSHSQDSSTDTTEVPQIEPSLTRNFTVRSYSAGVKAQEVDNGGGDTDPNKNWTGLDGVTRVNSLVQLPRFSGDREIA